MHPIARKCQTIFIISMARYLAAIFSLVAAQNTPEQVWVSFGSTPLTSLIVSFASPSQCLTPSLKAGTSNTTLISYPVAPDAPFYFNNAGGVAFYYRSTLTGLTPGTKYFYTVSACGAWSSIFSVSTLPETQELTVLLTGDMGRDDGEQILPMLVQEAEKAAGGSSSAANMFVIGGDFAYDMHDKEGARGAAYMGRLSTVSSYIPTVMTIGVSVRPFPPPMSRTAPP